MERVHTTSNCGYEFEYFLLSSSELFEDKMGEQRTLSGVDDLVLLIFLVVILLIIIGVSLLVFYQSKLFSPSRISGNSWNPHFTEIYLGVDSGKSQVGREIPGEVNINGRYYDRGGEYTLLFFHGNTGNISHRNYVVDLTSQIDYNLFMIDYRSYGKSQGESDPRTVLEDGIIAYNYLSKNVSPEKIVVWGESLGGSVATYVAIKKKVRSLILMGTFTSVSDIIENGSNYPSLRRIFAQVVRYSGIDLKPKEWIYLVKVPVLIIHSTEDELIPYHLARENYRRIENPHKRLVAIRGGHSTPSFSRESLGEIFTFLGIKRWSKYYRRVDQILGNVNPEEWS